MYKISRFPILLAGAFAAVPAAAQLTQGELPTDAQVAAGEVKSADVPAGAEPVQAPPVALPPGKWTDGTAKDLLAYIERVGEEGLDPADYNPGALRSAIEGGDKDALRRTATDTFMRLSSDLALGHVRGDARVQWHVDDSDLNGNDQYALMERAVANGSVADSLNSLLPTHPQYTELKAVLASSKDAAVIAKVRTNLDRWRWLPRDLGQRYVIVNVPAYTVALVEDGQVVARHRAVVGAPKTATPQLSATATGVIFNPWWEVPKSIAPEVRGKRGYVKVSDGEGGVRFRQPPGAGNSLGRMKVVMPNNYAIYLHDTPSKSLFKKDARAFSHGCIRTQDALGFAQVLLGNPQWDKTAIDQAIAAGKTVKADATVPTPVYITYFTAAAANDGGIVSYGDIYGRDGTVVAALNDGSGTALASAE